MSQKNKINGAKHKKHTKPKSIKCNDILKKQNKQHKLVFFIKVIKHLASNLTR